jgi:hypothetical protein
MGKKNCAKCRAVIPASACTNPRINSALVMAIRHAKAAAAGENRPAAKPQHFMANDDRPDQVKLEKLPNLAITQVAFHSEEMVLMLQEIEKCTVASNLLKASQILYLIICF